MAEIHIYQREKEKMQNKTDYRDKIRRHRLKGLIRIILILLVVGILIALVSAQYKNHVYTSYDTISSLEREKVEGTTDVRLGNSILTYSRDGAHCTDAKGNVVWNQTYEIQDVRLDICQDVAVIASYNGRDVYVVSEDKVLGSFSTNYPIRNVAVAATGRVTIVMADTKTTHYNTYSAEGKLLYEGEATMSGSGYPVAVSISPNGELLQIAYMYLDAGVQKTNVAFYNLGPVGANSADYLVRVQEYKDLLIPYVQFMNNETSFAVGDSMLIMYKGDQKPVPQAQFLYDQEVKAVFYNENYIGLIFYAQTGNSLYMMNVYNTDCEQIGTYYFNIEYTDVVFTKEAFIVYNDAECTVMTYKNEQKYSGSFDTSVHLLLPLKTAYKYLLVTGDSLDTIQLK